jgi:general secretion pathway protein D
MRAVALTFVSAILLNVVALQAQVRPAQGGVILNFQDADLAYVFSALAQAAGVNIIYSNLPARPITLRTFQPVPPRELMGLINSLAEANGISVSEGNGFVRLQGAGPGEQGVPDLRQLFIHRLRHARAPVLAETLGRIFGITTIGNQRTVTSAQTLSQQLAQMQAQQAQVQRQVPIVVGGGPALLGSVMIVADEVTNSLLIRATPADYQIIQQAIQSLDLRPLQVLIEVLIVEVRRTNALDVGVEFGGQDARRTDRNISGGLPQAVDTAQSFIIRYSRTGEINIDATLSALARTGNVRILSRPVIQAQNNQEAQIEVGEQRPFVQVSRTLPTDQSGVRDEVVQYRDVATTLTLTPTINVDGYVNLAIVQEVNNASNAVQFNAPIITTRSATTQLLARDGQTVVIGGLIDNQEERTRSGIPYLKDIPLIGWLFGGLRTNQVSSELFLFLTPHIVETDADADRIRREIEQNAPQLRKIAPIRPLVTPIQRPDTIRR